MIWMQELRLFVRERAAIPALLLLLALSAASVAAGMVEIAHERAVIARIRPKQSADVAALANGRNPAAAAYDTAHLTWNAPTPLAFAALGQRDVAPYVLRIRALGLEAQLYDGETFNPELTLPGRFDFAFVLTYLLPIFVIMLLYDLRAREAEANRLAVLHATARRPYLLWLRRRAVRGILLIAAVLPPFFVGAVLSHVPGAQIIAVSLLALLYLTFWMTVTVLIERLHWRSTANAGALVTCWLVLTLLIPALANLGINGAVQVQPGVDLALAHRQKVHAAWEIPREQTLAAFYRRNPHWSKSPAPRGFDDKWYFAFHEVADQSVYPAARAYEARLLKRNDLARYLGYMIPAVGLQVRMHRLAETDLLAQLAYQQRIRVFHKRIREFYYGYMFRDIPFTGADYAKAPRWVANGTR